MIIKRKESIEINEIVYLHQRVMKRIRNRVYLSLIIKEEREARGGEGRGGERASAQRGARERMRVKGGVARRGKKATVRRSRRAQRAIQNFQTTN